MRIEKLKYEKESRNIINPPAFLIKNLPSVSKLHFEILNCNFPRRINYAD